MCYLATRSQSFRVIKIVNFRSGPSGCGLKFGSKKVNKQMSRYVSSMSLSMASPMTIPQTNKQYYVFF